MGTTSSTEQMLLQEKDRRQKQKVTLEQAYTESQLQIDDICCRILSEMELLIHGELPNFPLKYTAFSSGSHGPTKRMLNIQMYAKGLQILSTDDPEALKVGLPKLKVYQPPEVYMQYLRYAHSQLFPGQVQEMLTHIISGLDKQSLKPVPASLSEKIMPSKERDVILRGIPAGNQTLVEKTLAAAYEAKQQLDQNLDKRRDKPIFPGAEPSPLAILAERGNFAGLPTNANDRLRNPQGLHGRRANSCNHDKH